MKYIHTNDTTTAVNLMPETTNESEKILLGLLGFFSVSGLIFMMTCCF